MEIDNKVSPIQIDAYIQKAQDRNTQKTPVPQTKEPAMKEDTVELSQSAQEILKAKHRIDSIPDVREEKVAEIKNQINEGTYKIDGKKVAHNMLRETLIDEIV